MIKPNQLSSLVAIAALAIAAPARADDPKAQAKTHVEAATAHHAAGRFAEALDELLLAYQLDPQPGLLYAIAQVYVKLDRCPDAITYYQKFIDSQPEEKASAAAHQAIEVCKEKPVTTPEPKPEPVVPPEVTPAKPTPIESPIHDIPARPAWYKDPVGGALVGAGVVSGVVGILLYRAASRDLDAAEVAQDYGTSESLDARAHTRRTYAAVAAVGGIALIAAGVVRYVVARPTEQHDVAIIPTSGGAAITWGGRF